MKLNDKQFEPIFGVVNIFGNLVYVLKCASFFKCQKVDVL